AITSDVIKDAVDRLGDSLDGLEERAGRSLGQAFSSLGTSLAEFFGRADDATGITSGLTFVIDGLAEGITAVARDAFPDLSERVKQAEENVRALEAATSDGGQTLSLYETELTSAAGSSQALASAQQELRDVQLELVEAIALGQIGTGQITAGIGSYNEAVTDLSSDLGTVVNDVEGFTASARDQAASLADNELALEKVSEEAVNTTAKIRALDQVFFEFREETEALDQQGRELAGTFSFLARNSRDAALAANEHEAAIEKLDGVFEEFEQETENLENSFRGLATSVGEFVGLAGSDVEAFFGNFRSLLGQLGVEVDASFRGIAQTVGSALGLSTEQLDGFFGLASRGLGALGIEFEDIIGKKATGLIQTFASLSSNEIGALGDIFSGVAGVIGNIFNPSVESASSQVEGLGTTGNQALGTVSAGVQTLVDDFLIFDAGVVQSGAQMGTFGQLGQTILGTLSTLWAQFTGLSTEQFTGFITTITGLFTGFSGSSTGIIGTLGNLWTQFTGNSTTQFGGFIDTALGLFSNFNVSSTGIIGAIGNLWTQ
ncbi:MAG: hypothetical protein ACR2RE_31905, partial [Geminicoccaceae bacterium]